MNQPLFIYLIRHGETDWNCEDRLQGHSDIPLNHRGKAQARDIAERLKQVNVSQIYSSDLSRALETATIISSCLELNRVTTSELLRERYFGYGEGKTWNEIQEVMPGCRQMEQLPDVEALADVQKRAFTILARIQQAHQGESVVVVTHGAWMEAVMKAIDPSIQKIIGNGECLIFSPLQDGWEWKEF